MIAFATYSGLALYTAFQSGIRFIKIGLSFSLKKISVFAFLVYVNESQDYFYVKPENGSFTVIFLTKQCMSGLPNTAMD